MLHKDTSMIEDKDPFDIPESEPDFIGPDIEKPQPIEPIEVWVNAGFGGPSFKCLINADCTMTLPDVLVKELGLRPGDDLEWDFNEADVTLYIKVKEEVWEAPEWLSDDVQEND